MEQSHQLKKKQPYTSSVHSSVFRYATSSHYFIHLWHILIVKKFSFFLICNNSTFIFALQSAQRRIRAMILSTNPPPAPKKGPKLSKDSPSGPSAPPQLQPPPQ